MTGSRYDAFEDPYCYKNSFVLMNKAGLRDADLREAFELEMSELRAEEPLPDGLFDPTHYCAVHHHLFQDVYSWAGAYRTVNTAKGGSSFCAPDYILDHLGRVDDQKYAERFAFTHAPSFGANWRVPKELLTHLVTDPWMTLGGTKDIGRP